MATALKVQAMDQGHSFSQVYAPFEYRGLDTTSSSFSTNSGAARVGTATVSAAVTPPFPTGKTKDNDDAQWWIVEVKMGRQNVGNMYFRDFPQQHFGQVKNTCALCQSTAEICCMPGEIMGGICGWDFWVRFVNAWLCFKISRLLSNIYVILKFGAAGHRIGSHLHGYQLFV